MFAVFTCASSIGNISSICFGCSILIPCPWVDLLGGASSSISWWSCRSLEFLVFTFLWVTTHFYKHNNNDNNNNNNNNHVFIMIIMIINIFRFDWKCSSLTGFINPLFSFEIISYLSFSSFSFISSRSLGLLDF